MAATSPNRLAGVASLTIDGQSFALVGELTWRVNDFTVETLKGQDGVHGTKEMPESGMIKGKLRDTDLVSVTSLTGKRNSSVVAQNANGKVISGSNMWRVGGPPEVNTEDATFDIEFEGASVMEVQ